MTGSRVFENARILWRTPSAAGNEYNFLVDIKLNGILPWQGLLYSPSQEAYMPSICFSFPADVPPDTGTRDAVQPDPPGLRRMPTSYCFSNPANVPRSMPLPCFSYSVDAPVGIRNRDTAQPALPGLRRMPNMCFSY